ncbi:MAG: EMC3/TMCO1 family protein [Nanoarchaeota archaeon]|nr:EMC3/TMCO1 family protein [Nanoarchaeota archaeon]
MVLEAINPVTYMSPLLATIFVSIVVTVFMTLVYKWMTDQKEMKRLKDEIKKCTDEMKGKKDPKKVMELQKKAMQTNMQYFTKSLKPTLVTFIPLILIFAWLNNSLSYESIKPNQEFTTTITINQGIIGNAEITTSKGLEVIGDAKKDINSTKITWILKGQEGEHMIEYKLNGQSCADCRKTALVTNQKMYAPVMQYVKNNGITKIEIGNEPLKVIWKLSWVWIYIIISIILSMALRKVMKIY